MCFQIKYILYVLQSTVNFLILRMPPLTPAFLYVSLDLSGTFEENLHPFTLNFDLEEKPKGLPLPHLKVTPSND